MTASFNAELLKLRKRPATWVLGLIFAVATVLFGYLFIYLFLVNAPGEQAGLPQEARDGILMFLLPASVVPNVVGIFAQFGGALALILGALAAGSEYGWDTLKTSLTQKPSRLSFFAGKLLGVAVLLLVFTVMIFAVGVVASYVIAAIEDAPVEWPSAGEMLKGVGAGWLILMVFAAIGVFLAMLFRGTALAIGIGLVYLLVLENIFLNLTSRNETAADIGKRLPANNALSLSESFGQFPPQFGGAPGEQVEPSTAVLTLGIYAVVCISLGALLLKRRDIS